MPEETNKTMELEPKKAEIVEATPVRERATVELLRIVADADMQQVYAKQIIEAEVSRDRFNQDWRLAKVFADSGVFEDLKRQTPEQGVATAMAKIEMGRGWGLSPADSVRHIYFVQGKPALENEVIAGKLREAGFSWQIEWTGDRGQVSGCTLWVERNGAPLLGRDGNQVSVSFGKEEADNIKVKENEQWVKLSEKAMYKSGYGRDLYYWKCIARVKRWYAPEVLRGVITREEADEIGGNGREIPPSTVEIRQPERVSAKTPPVKVEAEATQNTHPPANGKGASGETISADEWKALSGSALKTGMTPMALASTLKTKFGCSDGRQLLKKDLEAARRMVEVGTGA